MTSPYFTGTERFDVLNHIGSGGMGEVYKVYDRLSDSTIALKIIRHKSTLSIFRFKKEFRALSDLKHPNLVELYELLFDRDSWFFTMEFIDGVDPVHFLRGNYNQRQDRSSQETKDLADKNVKDEKLSEYLPSIQKKEAIPGINRGINLPPEEMTLKDSSLNITMVMNVFEQLSHAIYYLHSEGIIHRDLKTSNVLVVKDGQVKLLDFGLIKEFEERKDFDFPEGITGTPVFMAPEQIFNRQISPATDWYSFGIILYEVLTGELPYKGETLSIFLQKESSNPTPPRELIPTIDPFISDFCCALLKREPDDRPSGDEIIDFFEKYSPRKNIPHYKSQSQISRLSSFVGRQSELQKISEVMKNLDKGEFSLVEISGPTGIGKTSLIKHFLSGLQQNGVKQSNRSEYVVFKGRCLERERLPYKALDSIIDELSATIPSLPEEDRFTLFPPNISVLLDTFPVLKTISEVHELSFLSKPVVDPQERKRLAFRVCYQLFQRLGKLRHCIFVIDDFQWADDDSIELLHYIFVLNKPPPVFLLIAYRTEEDQDGSKPNRFLNQIRATEKIARISLQNLPPEEARILSRVKIAEGQAGLIPESSALLEQIVAETAGNPFYIVEYAHYLNHQYGLTKNRDTTFVHLSDVLSERTKNLPEESHVILKILAVAGEPLPQIVLSKASAFPLFSDVWLRGVSYLQIARLIIQKGFRDMNTIEINHEQTRISVLEGITEAEQKSMHRDIVLALESLQKAPLESLAHHWLAIGEIDRAKSYFRKAAHQSSRSLAFRHAISLYDTLLKLESQGRERSELYHRKGECLAFSGRPYLAAEAFQRAAENAQSVDRLDLLSKAADQLFRGGYVREGLQTIKIVLDIIGIRPASTPFLALISVIIHTFIAEFYYRNITFRDKNDISPREDMILNTLWSVTIGLSMADTIRGADFHARFLIRALKSGDRERIVPIMALQAVHEAGFGAYRFKKAATIVDHAEKISKKLAEPKYHAFVLIAKGGLDLLSGKWNKALESLKEAELTLQFQSVGLNWELATTRLWICFALIHRGNLNELTQRYFEHSSEASSRGDCYSLTSMLAGFNLIQLIRDDEMNALKDIEEAEKSWPRETYHMQHFFILNARCELYLYQNDPLKARRLIEKEMTFLHHSFLMKIQFVRAEVYRLYARILAMCAVHSSSQKEKELLGKKIIKLSRSLHREKQDFIKAWATLTEAMGRFFIDQGFSKMSSQLFEKSQMLLEKNECLLYHAACHYMLTFNIEDSNPGPNNLNSNPGEFFVQQKVKNPAKLSQMLVPIWTIPKNFSSKRNESIR